jgi:hypothetical protein
MGYRLIFKSLSRCPTPPPPIKFIPNTVYQHSPPIIPISTFRSPDLKRQSQANFHMRSDYFYLLLNESKPLTASGISKTPEKRNYPPDTILSTPHTLVIPNQDEYGVLYMLEQF